QRRPAGGWPVVDVRLRQRHARAGRNLGAGPLPALVLRIVVRHVPGRRHRRARQPRRVDGDAPALPRRRCIVTPNPYRRRLIVVAVVALVALGGTRAAAFRRARPLPGTSVRQLVIGGVTRTYLLRAGGEAKSGRPLGLVLHGLAGTAAALERRTRGTFDTLADQLGAVIVYPQ